MLTLPEAKLHLRVDFPDDDEYIGALVAVATETIRRLTTPAGGEPVEPNETLRHAARLLVGHWYANREAAAEAGLTEVPLAFKLLVGLNRPAESFL